MYFYKKDGKQCLDLKGDLILSHNDELVKTFPKSAGPSKILAPEGYILNINKARFFKRIYITFRIIAFVFAKDKALTPENSTGNKPHVKGDCYSPDTDDLDDNNPPKDYTAPCINNENNCPHSGNLDRSCIGYDNCGDYRFNKIQPSE